MMAGDVKNLRSSRVNRPGGEKRKVMSSEKVFVSQSPRGIK